MPDLVVVSLGAGVQSTTLLLMAARGEIEPLPHAAIFADTGWEPRAVYEHLDWLEREVGGRIPIYRVSAGNIKEDILRAVRKGSGRIDQPPFWVRGADGTASPLRRKCTRAYKVVPIQAKIRELLGVRPGQRVTATVEQWYGISLDEVYRMRTSDVPWITNRYPLIEMGMDRWSCLLWLRRHGYPEPPKSACIGCPYHSDHYWRHLRDHSPEEWAEAVELDRAIRHGLPGVEQPAYLHRSLRPLDEVDLSTPEERGQQTFDLDAFVSECEGLCGV